MAGAGGDLRAERLHRAVVVQPDHQLGTVGLAGRRRRLVEPDVVGDVVVVAAAGLRGAPARGDLARGDGRSLDRVTRQAARRAVAPVAALVDGRVAAGRAVGGVADGRVGDREVGVAVGRDALRRAGAPLVVLHGIYAAAHGRRLRLAKLGGRRTCAARPGYEQPGREQPGGGQTSRPVSPRHRTRLPSRTFRSISNIRDAKATAGPKAIKCQAPQP